MNNSEKEIHIATQGKQLQHFRNADMNDLKGILVKWVYMLGLTQKVNDKDIIALTKITQELFPKMTVKQIELAIKYSLQGVLDCDIECYGNFSPVYVSKILNAYLKFSREKIHEINWRTKSIDKMNEQREQEKPYEEQAQQTRDIIKLYIERVITTNNYMGDYNHVVWDLMKRTNYLDPSKIDLQEADEWADNRVRLEAHSTEAKRYSKMSFEQREKEMSLFKRLYGRYYVLKKIFRTMDKPLEWLESLPNEIILPKNAK